MASDLSMSACTEDGVCEVALTTFRFLVLSLAGENPKCATRFCRLTVDHVPA